MSRSTPLPCLDCGVNTSTNLDWPDAIAEYYHVWEDVWFEAFGRVWDEGAPWDEKERIIMAGYLCLGCLEARIGRRLVPSDFSDCPVNDPAATRCSERHLDRMGKL